MTIFRFFQTAFCNSIRQVVAPVPFAVRLWTFCWVVLLGWCKINQNASLMGWVILGFCTFYNTWVCIFIYYIYICACISLHFHLTRLCECDVLIYISLYMYIYIYTQYISISLYIYCRVDNCFLLRDQKIIKDISDLSWEYQQDQTNMRKAPAASQKVVKSDGSIIDLRAARDFATKKKIRWSSRLIPIVLGIIMDHPLWWTNIAMERFTMLFMGKSTISTGPFSIAM